MCQGWTCIVMVLTFSHLVSAWTIRSRNGSLPAPENIMIVFGDDVGYGDLGTFGHPTSRTPNLDKMASQGSKLVQYLSAANICSPSRASLMTGRSFVRVGIWPGVLSPISKGGLPLNETTIASSLRTLGFTTGMCGKWHLGTNEYHPTHHGFDFYFGAHMTQNECVSNINSPGAALVAGVNGPVTSGNGKSYGACPIFNGSTDVPSIQRNMLATPPRVFDLDDVDDEYDTAAARFIRDAAGQGKRWFFYFASHHTHVPQFTGDRRGYTLRGLQGDSLSLLDRSVGRLLDLFAELNIDDKTLLIFSADNGGARYWGPDIGGVNGELACGKMTTWEGGHRVPTIIRWPSVVTPGTINQELISSLDWYPTVAYVVGFELNSTLVYDGVENAEAIFFGGDRNESQDVDPISKREYFPYYSSSVSAGPGGEWPPLLAIRDRQYKLHLWTKGAHRPTTGRQDWVYPAADVCAQPLTNWTHAPLLFDLYRDPGENVPRTPLSGWNGTWPAPAGWHSGSMPEALYNATVARLLAAFEEERASMPISVSEMNKGQSPDRFPCCSPGCTPLPHCCTCDTDINTRTVPSNASHRYQT